jgi:hypothetical protein
MSEREGAQREACCDRGTRSEPAEEREMSGPGLCEERE